MCSPLSFASPHAFSFIFSCLCSLWLFIWHDSVAAALTMNRCLWAFYLLHARHFRLCAKLPNLIFFAFWLENCVCVETRTEINLRTNFRWVLLIGEHILAKETSQFRLFTDKWAPRILFSVRNVGRTKCGHSVGALCTETLLVRVCIKSSHER